jgi:hypothetical protein
LKLDGLVNHVVVKRFFYVLILLIQVYTPFRQQSNDDKEQVNIRGVGGESGVGDGEMDDDDKGKWRAEE